MKKLITIGEALIDFIAKDNALVKDVESFVPSVGGAPANVCGAFAKLGGSAAIISMLGNDAFGDKIIEHLNTFKVDTSYIRRTDLAQTSLAFVSRILDGNRDFTFFRKPGADMLLSENMIEMKWFDDSFALHFCSVDLGDFPMRRAHIKAIEYAKSNKAIISFDPNLRFSLWPNQEELKSVVRSFMKYADIIKISSEELMFITGKADIKAALPDLFSEGIELVIYTKGNKGASAYTKKSSAVVEGIRCENVIDTTGAGDAFIGSFLFQLYSKGKTIDDLKELTKEELYAYLDFSNKYCALSIKKMGAIPSYPTIDEMKGKQNEKNKLCY